MITKEHFLKIGINEKWRETINIAFDEYNVIDTKEKAMFLAQCSHESKNFTMLEESFNYSAERLFEVFKQRVKTIEKAHELVKLGKKAVANFLYNGRMGNRYATDDGYNYRGRGVIQLTGRDNYTLYSKITGINLIDSPHFAKDKDIAVRIALEYWIHNKIGIPAKKGNTKAVTQIINGGLNGLKEREALFIKIKSILENK